MSMTSKERVLGALAHVEPDRVPIGYSANPEIDRRLKAHFGLDASDGGALSDALGVDFRGAFARYAGPNLHPAYGDRHVDVWGVRSRWIEHQSGGYWDFCDWPLKDADYETVDAWPMPSPDDYDYSHIAEHCRNNAQFAVFVGGGGIGCVINRAGKLRTMEGTLIDLATDDEAGLRVIRRKHDIELEVTRRSIEAADGAFDFLWMGEDLGLQRGPMISLDLYRKHLRPLHQDFIDLARSFDLPVVVHTCGSASFVYDDFIEMGVTAVEALQPEAKDMSPEYLKGRFGDRLVFKGCISTAEPMTNGTPEEVAEDVRATLDVMMPGGGYCFAPAHMLQDNTPVENVVAMYEAALRYGRY